jgi:hypothetical protein
MDQVKRTGGGPKVTDNSQAKQVTTPEVDKTVWDILNNYGKHRFQPGEDK